MLETIQKKLNARQNVAKIFIVYTSGNFGVALSMQREVGAQNNSQLEIRIQLR